MSCRGMRDTISKLFNYHIALVLLNSILEMRMRVQRNEINIIKISMFEAVREARRIMRFIITRSRRPL